MSNGSLADVRIIEVDEQRLYVPVSWITFWGRGANEWKSSPGTYSPDLNKVECAGTVHKFVGARGPFNLDLAVVDRIRGRASKNFSLGSTIERFSIARPQSGDFVDRVADWTPHPAAYVTVVPRSLVAIYDWPKVEPIGSAKWDEARHSMIELVNWLKTKPANRDNDRIFKLGTNDR